MPMSGAHAGSAKPASAEQRKEPNRDPRLASVRAFFERGKCPAAELSTVFLEASAAQGLDWRLLPSLCFLESTGGKSARNNNLFGWDSGRAAFSSAVSCIHSVAYSLAHSQLYRHKDVNGMLRTYNRSAGYASRVRAIMRRIGPVEAMD